MNQPKEKFPRFSLAHARSYCEDMQNFILSIISEYGEDAKKAAPYVILGCLCVWIYVKRYWSPKRRSPHPVLQRSLSRRSLSLVKLLYGGELVLRRMDEALENHKKAAVNPGILENNECLLKALLKEEHLDLPKLQSTVVKLEMGRREGRAVEILEQAKKEHAGKPHEAYEIDMLLVEMLIYDGKWKEALNRECLNDKEITDARRPLFKAIIHTLLMLEKCKEGTSMLEKCREDQAKKYWEEFDDCRVQFIEAITPPYQTITNFEQFKDKVKDLKSTIEDNAPGNSARK